MLVVERARKGALPLLLVAKSRGALGTLQVTCCEKREALLQHRKVNRGRTMGENQNIEQLLDKLAELLKVKIKDRLIAMAKESNEVLEISTKDLEKMRQSERSADRVIQSGKTKILGNSVNLAHLELLLKFSRSNHLLNQPNELK